MTLSIESRIKPRLTAIDGSVALLARIANCSKTSLSEAAAGTSNLNRETALRVDAALSDLEQWIASIAPIKPDLRDARLVEQWLDDFRAIRAKRRPAPMDPWALLADLATGDIEEMIRKHNWSREQLLAQLVTAQERLREVTSSLAATNADRAALHNTL